MQAAKERTDDVFSLAAFLRCLPENRVWGSAREKQTFAGASGWLSSTVRWGCGHACDGPASGSTDQRFYASSYGRFNTVDPSGQSPSPAFAPSGLKNSLSWNRFPYTSGDPINNNDPSGLCTIAGVVYADGAPPCPDVTSVTVSGNTGFLTSLFSMILTSIQSGSGLKHNTEAELEPKSAALGRKQTEKSAQKFLCKGSPGERVIDSMLIGALSGAVRGAWWGFNGSEITFGAETAGLSGVGGILVGGVLGSIVGSSAGAIKGAVAAEICSELGAYDGTDGGTGTGGGTP